MTVQGAQTGSFARRGSRFGARRHNPYVY